MTPDNQRTKPENIKPETQQIRQNQTVQKETKRETKRNKERNKEVEWITKVVVGIVNNIVNNIGYHHYDIIDCVDKIVQMIYAGIVRIIASN